MATEAPIGTPVVDLSQIFAGVHAAARAINASGGIHGHPIVVRTCNGQVNPNVQVQCARDAVNSGAVAMVGNFLGLGGQADTEALLQAASTADLATSPDDPSQFESAVSFPLIPLLPTLVTECTSPALAKAAHEKVKVVNALNQIPGADLTTAILSSSSSAQGGNSVQFLGGAKTGTSTTDLSPLVAQLAATGANFVVLDLLPPQVAALVTASATAGKTWGYCGLDTEIPPAQIIRLGSTFSKLYEGSPFPPLSAASHYPQLQRFLKEMRAEVAAGDGAASTSVTNYTFEGLNAWLGMQVFDQVAKSISGPINHESFLAALKNAKVNLGVTAPINFAHPTGSGPFPRVFNSKLYLDHWNTVKKHFELVPGGVIENSFAISGLGKS